MKEGLKEFAEEYYWNHIARFRFVTLMARGFNQHMVLPEKFVKYSKEDLSESVILKGPSGNLWLVKLMKVQGDLILKEGWKEFTKAHNIEEGDMLSFEYERNSCFNVLIYDMKSRCEREASYFAINHTNIIANTSSLPKKRLRENTEEARLEHLPTDNNENQSPRTNNDDSRQVAKQSSPVCPTTSRKGAPESYDAESDGQRKEVGMLSSPVCPSAERKGAPESYDAESDGQRKKVGKQSSSVSPSAERKSAPESYDAETDSQGKKVEKQSSSVCLSAEKKSAPESCDVESDGQRNKVAKISSPVCPSINGKSAPESCDVESDAQRIKVRKSERLGHPKDSPQIARNTENLSQTTPRNDDTEQKTNETTTLESPNASQVERRSKHREDTAVSTKKRGRPRKVQENTDKEMKLPVPERALYDVHLVSNRRAVTDEEKNSAFERAGEMKPDNPFFRVVMLDTHVYKQHFMTIPAEFVSEHLSNQQTADLRIKKTIWHDVPLVQQGSSIGLSGQLWRNFVQANTLEEGDTCIFELCSADKILLFDVHIFRVVEEIVPLDKQSVVLRQAAC